MAASGWDNPKTIEAMQFIEKLTEDGSMPGYNTIAENEPIALMQSGKVGMCLLGSWHLAAMADNEYALEHCDVAVLPSYNGTEISIYNGLAWSASANTPKAEEALKLITYFGSKEAQKMQADLGVTDSPQASSMVFFDDEKKNHLWGRRESASGSDVFLAGR